MTETEDGRRRPRSITTDEREWACIVEQARAAGLSVSRFAAERALEPGSRDGSAG